MKKFHQYPLVVFVSSEIFRFTFGNSLVKLSRPERYQPVSNAAGMSTFVYILIFAEHQLEIRFLHFCCCYFAILFKWSLSCFVLFFISVFFLDRCKADRRCFLAWKSIGDDVHTSPLLIDQIARRIADGSFFKERLLTETPIALFSIFGILSSFFF